MKVTKLMTVEEPDVFISRPQDVVDMSIRSYLNEQKQEHFLVVAMNGQHKVEYVRVCHVGTLNASMVAPRDVFRDAVANNVAAIIVVHNHPSGRVDPSEPDINTTRQLEKCGRILGIDVLDSIIVSKDGYFSFLEHKMIGGDDD